MTYDNYPTGMSTADLIHVGELIDPNQAQQEFFEEYEPTGEQVIDWMYEHADSVYELLKTYPNAIDMLNEAYKEFHEEQIKEEHELF